MGDPTTFTAKFNTAQAALIWSDASVDLTMARTHSGLISTFSRRLVKTGFLPVELGRDLNRVAEIRLVADYSGDEVSIEKAQWAIERAASFIEIVQRKFAAPK